MTVFGFPKNVRAVFLSREHSLSITGDITRRVHLTFAPDSLIYHQTLRKGYPLPL